MSLTLLLLLGLTLAGLMLAGFFLIVQGFVLALRGPRPAAAVVHTSRTEP